MMSTNQIGKILQKWRWFGRVCLALGLVLSSLAPLLPRLAPSAQAAALAAPLAQTNTLTLNVISARTEPLAFGGAGVLQGDPITEYKYIINQDNTGQTTQRTPADGCSPSSAGYPGSCLWTSVAGVPGSSPIYTQGDQSDFVSGLTLPPDRYLISVLADGYKLDGAHFTVPLSGPLTVELQPTPLPDATIHAYIFEDNAITNSAPDVPVEQGLPGFVGHINDYLGEVTTDIYGNLLCTRYAEEFPTPSNTSPTYLIDTSLLQPPDYAPTPIPGTGGRCVSDANGDLVIPHLGTNRYALYVSRPDGTNWVQTTTLEGNHDWDSWIMEGNTGYDTEFVVAGEPFPTAIFGFVQPKTLPAGPNTHHITGIVNAVKTYVPAKGGLGLPGTHWGGTAGAKLAGPIKKPWLALADLNTGDAAIWVGQGDNNGNFDIPNVPDGNYTLTWWDEPQDYLLDFVNVTVSGGDVNMGILPLTGWWTRFEGYVFNDLNRNGIKDGGEPGIPNFGLTMRRRENSLMDRGTTAVSTDASGFYFMESTYPMTQWLVMEAYDDRFYTTGITYQADNQNQPTTVLGAGVDISVLPIIGLGGRVDWGVHFYDPTGATCNPVGTYENCLDPRNGGIVGTISYDTTRNELDPRYAAVEDWQPSISNLTVKLYAPVDCGTTSAPCDPTDRYELVDESVDPANAGAYAKGKLLNAYLTETWERPTGCTARDVDGNPLVHGTDEQSLPIDPDADCLEGPLMGVQFGTYAEGQGTPDANFGAAVDGNYGFGDGCFDGTLDASDPASPACNGGSFSPLPAGGYLVAVEVPLDDLGRPRYKLTREEDINIANGDQIIPQVPPPACAGALHTVDVANFGTDNYGPVTLPNGIVVPASTPTDNPTFLDVGGTTYEGTQKPLCDTKLVELANNKSIAPAFNYFTDVPLPGRFWGLIVDDLNFSGDPRSLLYGEKAGVPFAPVGIYDYTDRLVATVESDFNGLFDVLLPSTNRISCPTPSGVCANVYRYVGNDPGIPGRLNPNYKPEFRTIAAEFEAFPGLIIPADLAPTQVGVTVQLPGGQVHTVNCALDAVTPQLLAVSQPYVNGSGSFTIRGLGFGPTQGAGQVTLDGVSLPVTGWNDTDIAVTVPANTAIGPHQLSIKAANGQSTINGLTFHVLGSSVGPFPSTGVLDTFTNRTTMGGNWATDGGGGFAVINNGGTANDYLRIRTNNNSFSTGQWTSGPSFGANQEAYFTFRQPSSASTADEQGLMLKRSGSNTPTNGSAQWIEVALDNSPANTVNVYSKTAGSGAITLRATFTSPSAFVAGDVLGARALADGTINVYRNGAQIGTVNVAVTGSWTGDIGIRFEGTGNGSPASAETQIDDFGGGNVIATGYTPNLYEVGPGRTYAVIQDAIDAAAASNGDDLVVVYPGDPDFANPRGNPRGAYYENLIITAPVKLQGVGSGGFQGNTFVPGSIIDGGAFGGDTVLAENWRAKIATLLDPATGDPLWLGNPDINDGETIYMLALTPTAFGADTAPFATTFKTAIDGFDLRGANQQGFPTNINVIGGGPTGLPPDIVTQGGAIFANAYVRNLQITNNMVQNNGGGYGTIRIGTPDLPAPDTNQHNENVRIANNRLIANAGTNLAGAIGLFAGADNYEVAGNDICGNFSAEYGGGISVYGRSPNGKIHHNRIYFNRSFDEGGGIMIAGELPANPASLSPGSGSVDIYNNLIQANLGNDDGGGIRFLMAGGPGGVDAMNVYNNMIVNNVSTHEGGGIGLNDAPNVRVYNNTIMKNMTTATAITSLGAPAPAGLSTSRNSTLLQATLPGGVAGCGTGSNAPCFSNPFLFNNIFWDNRAGTRAGAVVTGLDLAGANLWDLGVADPIAPNQVLAPTNSVVQQNAGVHPYTTSPTNSVTDPTVVAQYDVSLAFNVWRNNPGFVGAILVAVDLPANLLGNYHLPGTGSPAYNLGAASKTAGTLTVNAPTTDIDNEARPALGGFDSGADEYPGNIVNLSISKTDGQANAVRGSQVTYSIVVVNSGPNAVSLAPVVDNVPVALTGVTWTCAATGGSSCNAASGSGNTINTSVNLANGGSTTFTVVGTLPANAAAGSLVNTATVAVPAGATDPNPGDNSATDTDTIVDPPADLSITKSDGVSSISGNNGTAVNYTIIVHNGGPGAVTGATVTDNFPSILTVGGWTCSATAGSSCTATGTGNNRTGTVTLLNGGDATFTANTTLSNLATGNLINTATVTAASDLNPANNSATDTDTIVPTLPTLTVLDNFNRANANTLNNGANWSQVVIVGSASIRVNTNQAFCTGGCALLPGQAIWNNPVGGFGATQGAALTFAGTTFNNVALFLKASGGTANLPASFIRVRYQTGSGGQVVVATTTNAGVTYPTVLATFNSGPFIAGDTLSAVANTDGSVDVWKNSTYIGHSAPSSFTSTGRIGMQLPNGARVDDFRGGSVGLIVLAVGPAGGFPQTALLDNFTTANGALPATWAGATSSFRVIAKRVESRSDRSRAIWWNTAFGANQEAHMTLTKIGKSTGTTRWQGLLLKFNGSALADANASAIDVRYSSNHGVRVRTMAPGQGWVIQATLSDITFKNGDRLGASALADGTVIVYKNADPLGSVNVLSGPNPWSAALAAGGGWTGATYTFKGGRFDNFGSGDSTAIVSAAAAVSQALGEVEAVDESTTDTDTPDTADDTSEADLPDDPEVFDAEAIEYELFMPVVIGITSSNELDQAEATPPKENQAENQSNSNIYLPFVSNQ